MPPNLLLGPVRTPIRSLPKTDSGMRTIQGRTGIFVPVAQIHRTGMKSNALRRLADPTRFERATSAFGGQRSIQLSYGSLSPPHTAIPRAVKVPTTWDDGVPLTSARGQRSYGIRN